MFCKQAQWDNQGIIDRNLERALLILQDEKPTAVRQALTALKGLFLYKEHLSQPIKEKILAIAYDRYKETMHSLIAKDIDSVLVAKE